jgi:curved DNA-binding protein CbpA
MKIDRSNYEIWIIDWLDGKLSDQQIEELNTFLNENPGLREEFDGLASVKLERSPETFPDKNLLKRSVAGIDLSQFEYLCVAFYEGDLTSDQQQELQHYILKDPEKKKVFDLTGKVKLTPSGLNYKYKKQLMKSSPLQRAVRLSVISLSAAAAIALLIVTWLLLPHDIDKNIPYSALNQASDSINIQQADKIKKDDFMSENASVQAESNVMKLPVNIQNNSSENITSPTDPVEVLSPVNAKKPIREMPVVRIIISADLQLKPNITKEELIRYDYPERTALMTDERSNIGKFIAKNFRDKILKEEESDNTPLKGYEIAQAGVTGLNKLLGWEMAFDKTNDENGDTRSVYFSSRMLKFSAPVNKSVTAE